MHGPCVPPLSYCPPFTDLIDVIDDVVNTIKPTHVRKRRRWREARDRGLALWNPAVTFDVTEGQGAVHDYFDPDRPLDTYLTPLVIPGLLRLVRDKTPPGGRDDVAIVTRYGAVASIDLEKPITDPIYEWFRLVAHEVGHCLGLVHGSAGRPLGIMLGGLEPNEHDLKSVRDYYA